MKIPSGGSVKSFMPAPIDDLPVDPWREPWPSWTLEDTKHAARIAASRTRGGAGYSDASVTAWEGVAIHVAEYPESSWVDAVNAGARAVSVDYNESRRGQRTDGASTGARFITYWVDRPREGSDLAFVERLSVHQVLSGLSDRHRETLLMRAAHDSDSAMAEYLGLTQSGVSRRVRESRVAFINAWFDWETPPPTRIVKPTSKAIYCRNGHRWSENTQYTTGRKRKCAACNRESVARSRLKK